MADLTVDERTLTSVAWRVSSAAVAAEVSTTLMAGSEADVGSPGVAGALDEVTGQLVRRAGLAVEAIQAVGDFPTTFVREFEQVESRLAAGVPVDDLAGVGAK
ncbi:hypothetical protein [Frigoribacterium sp. PhB24]|uniref:hypothetical protein n=1 Tax=Frigoribacterium sp. PhB24 TaxID=2485204 RepID=UPI000F9E63C0|nr:hypothetical protein [Frigoribacterium sp. PhB24]ROS54071.1 hypothetical protein EDF50_0145 [Frigoribacterium sp. PhB24]